MPRQQRVLDRKAQRRRRAVRSCHDPAEVFADPRTREQDMVIEFAHSGHGEVQMVGFPLKFDEAPCRIRRPAPDLGADTDAVLRELGYSTETIGRFRQEGVV